MSVRIITGDCREVLATLPDQSVQMCVTSPPYFGLRSYGTEPKVWGGDPECDHDWHERRYYVEGGGGAKTSGEAFSKPGTENAQRIKNARWRDDGICAKCSAWHGHLGLEPTLQMFIANLVSVFREVRRVLRDDGTLWLNIGDSYSSGGRTTQVTQTLRLGQCGTAIRPPVQEGVKPKDLMMVPARLAIALQDDGWWLRSDIIWAKRAPMPESVQGSHYARHRVTISEYERLSGLRYSPERSESNGFGDLPGVSTRAEVGSEAGVQQIREGPGTEPTLSAERQVSSGEASVSTEREGQGDCAGTGGTRGRSGEAPPVQPFTAGSAQQGDIRGDREGPGDQGEGNSEVSIQRSRQTEAGGIRPPCSVVATSNRCEAAGERAVSAVRKNEGEEASGLRATPRGNRSSSSVDSKRLDRDSGATQPQMPLLWEAHGVDDGSCYPDQQGRAAREGEHRPGLPELQFQEEQQPDSTLLVDCPGCPKCQSHGGYILHISAGRPTSAHEHIFLLTKRPRYYYDQEAIAEPGSETSHGGTLQRNINGNQRKIQHLQDTASSTLGGTADSYGGTRNARNVWHLGPEPYPDAHFATFPTEVPRRCISAGTSEKGQCPACGSPWVRVTARIDEGWDGSKYGERAVVVNTASGGTAKSTLGSSNGKLTGKSVTTGWQPSCSCDAGDPVPQTVLDPFSGAGTSGLVADRLGRNAILIELNESYAEMSRRRITNDAPLFAEVSA